MAKLTGTSLVHCSWEEGKGFHLHEIVQIPPTIRLHTPQNDQFYTIATSIVDPSSPSAKWGWLEVDQGSHLSRNTARSPYFHAHCTSLTNVSLSQSSTLTGETCSFMNGLFPYSSMSSSMMV